VRYSIENPQAYVQANLVGHLNMLEIARHRGVEHMVYASSSPVFGGNTRLPFAAEDRVEHPLPLYAATNKADELMSETYAHLYSVALTGLWFFTVYGLWGRPDMMMMWILTRKVLAGAPLPVFNHGEWSCCRCRPATCSGRMPTSTRSSALSATSRRRRSRSGAAFVRWYRDYQQV
jgi:UDP-glucuronate 4-epimerase